MTTVTEVVEFMLELKEDPEVSKRMRENVDAIVTLLNQNTQMAVEKALMQVEEMNASDVSTFHRTQLWEVASMLESISFE